MSKNEFNTGLFNCCADMKICCKGTFCMCCLSGQNMSSVMNEDPRCLYYVCCPSPFWTRKLIRTKYNIEPNDCVDCVSFAFCFPCGICQDAREISIRNSQVTV